MMFWKRKKDDRLVPHRNEVNTMVKALLDQADVDFDSASQLEQALVGTFAFGMIHTHGMLHSLKSSEIHGLVLLVFQDSLHYTSEAAAQGVQECINATAPAYHDTMHAILHRGIDGHKQYRDGDLDGLGQNMNSVLNQFRENDA